MSAFRRMLVFVIAFVCLASLCAAQLADQLAAARVLGPHWRQMSRSAGMVFSGTVLGVEEQFGGKDRPLPVMVTKFRVDRAIAGVQPGQVLTVREWAGAWSMHRAMRSGQRMLIFLYPPSRLGLTSPVGGSLGQVMLDLRGEVVVTPAQGLAGLNLQKGTSSGPQRTAAAEGDVDSAAFAARLKSCPPENLSRLGAFPHPLKFSATQTPALFADCAAAIQPITLRQLERAIRSARKNSPAAPARIKE
jgi:hypothetical protein